MELSSGKREMVIEKNAGIKKKVSSGILEGPN
jgi:hypothetical protein